MAKIEPFETYSDRYDAWFDRNRDIYHAELEAVRRVLPPSPAKVLEVGVGSGRFAVPLGITIGVEPSAKMAAKAERQGITVFRATAEGLPFSDAGFDGVLMVTTVCFVDDVLGSFREAFRVLNLGGSFIVGFVDKRSRLGETYTEKRKRSVFYKVAVFFSAEEIGGYLTKAGFGDVSFMQTLIPGEEQGALQSGFGKGGFVVAKGVKNRLPSSAEEVNGRGL